MATPGPCHEEEVAVAAQLAIVATLMADLGMQVAELDARVQIFEDCQANNEPLMAVPGAEPVECRVKWSRRHIATLIESLRHDIRCGQIKVNAMCSIVRGDNPDAR